MFVAWRDLRFAKGRFALMGGVIVLISLLVVGLSGLTEGLARDSTSAIADLPVDRIVFAAPPEGQSLSFTESDLDGDTVDEWATVPGVQRAEPVGIATLRVAGNTRSTPLSAFGVRPTSPLVPGDHSVESGRAVLSTDAASALDATSGDTITIGEVELQVIAVHGDASFSHTPVIWMAIDDWQRASPGPAELSVIALDLDGDPDLDGADHRLGTRTVTRSGALDAIGSYTAENNSLQLMRGMLFAISALVIGAFFTVWTIQRSGDIAVLKALGARTSTLLGDALGQAVVLLGTGTAVGTGLAALAGNGLRGRVPFVLDPATLLTPALIMIGLGLAGAALAVRRITTVDPLTALGATR